MPNLGTSIFSQMTALANKHQALNLSQGFPEFDAPELLKKQLNHYVLEGKSICAFKWGYKATTANSGFDC